MFRNTIIGAAVLLLVGAVVAAAPSPYPSLCKGDYLLRGEIDPKMASTFRAADLKDGGTVILDSTGGDAAAALDIADIMLAKHMNVVVSGYCTSSCANYLFMAGTRKEVLPGGLVGFHGSPRVDGPVNYSGPESHRAIGMAQARAYVANFVARQSAFYARLGVDGAATYTAPVGFVFPQDQWAHTFWEYGPTALAGFGVKGIGHFATPSDRPWLYRLLGAQCTAVGADAWVCRT